MPQQKLRRAKIASLTVNLRRLVTSRRVGAITTRVEADGESPFPYQPCILPCRYMGSVTQSAWKEIGSPVHLGTANLVPDGSTGVFRQLELHRRLRLTKYNRCAFAHTGSDNEIADFQSDKVAASWLTVDCQIEHRQVSEVARQFEPRPNGPDLLRQQWSYLANQSSLVPRHALRFDSRELEFGHELSPIHPSRTMRRHRVDWLILLNKPNGRFWCVVPIGYAVLPQGSSEPNLTDAALGTNGALLPIAEIHG